MRKSIALCGLSLLLILAALPAPAQEPGDEAARITDWSDPDTVDPYLEGIGDFLDTDLAELEKTAREAYEAGEYEKAAQYYLATLHHNIGAGETVYNLACCYGLLGQAELASLYGERAVSAGFAELWMFDYDPDFEPVRGQPVFDEMVVRVTAALEEQRKEKGHVVYFDAPAYFRCNIKFPDGYDPQESYPLLVGLHGFGASPDNFIKLWDRFAEHDFIYASPQGPYALAVGNDTGYSWGMWTNGAMLPRRSAELSEEYIASVVEELTLLYNPSAVYLAGFSQGCAFSYRAGIKHHNLLDGLICFGGWLEDGWLTEDELEAGNHLRVFIAHGNQDQAVDFAEGMSSRDLLLEHGYDVTFHEFDGAHRVPAEPLQVAEEWMKNPPEEETEDEAGE